MPLETQVLRKGEPLKIWDLGHNGYWPLNCMYTAAIKDSVPDRRGLIAGDDEKTFGHLAEGECVDFSMSSIYYLNIPGCPLVEKGVQTLKNRYEFHADDDVIIFEPGDVLQAWRSHKS